VKIGYVMNSYPMVSTTFIGREIAALERQGLSINRYAIRPWPHRLVDPGDLAEQARTRYLLTGSRSGLFKALLWETLRNPVRLVRALRQTLRLIGNARGGVVRHVAYLVEAMVLHQATAADGVTHLHAHFSTNSTTVAMLSEVLGGPGYSFTIHGPDELFQPLELSLGLKIARARFVACISHFCRSQAMLFSDQAHWHKLRLVHCGVIPAQYGTRPRDSHGKHVLFIGRLDAVKGVPLLLQAFAAARARHPQARLTVVGDGPARKALEAQAAALGITDATTFTGYRAQTEVAALLEEADMLVLPSFAEGVPVVLMEAMASRIPVIASQVAGVPELVQDGVSGFVVPAGDVETLTARLERLLSDPDLCRCMGAAGRDKVVAEYDVDHEAAWLLTLFQGQGTGLRPALSTPAAMMSLPSQYKS